MFSWGGFTLLWPHHQAEGESLHGPITKLRHRTDLRQEAIAVMHRPYFDALATGEKINLDSGSRNRFSRGGNSQKLTAMGAEKREPVSDLFAFRNDVLNLDP